MGIELEPFYYGHVAGDNITAEILFYWGIM